VPSLLIGLFTLFIAMLPFLNDTVNHDANHDANHAKDLKVHP
jgi:hypothetical protein